MKLKPSVITKLANAMKKGLTIDVACDYAKIHRATFFRWQKKANAIYDKIGTGELEEKSLSKREQLFLDLREKLSVATASVELALLEKIQEMPPRWQALAWVLERRFRERYARRVMVDTELFLRHFEREHGADMAGVLRQVLDMAEAIAASKQSYDEPEMHGEQLQVSAGVLALPEGQSEFQSEAGRDEH